ncbi:MAG: XylR N-terminal domain-containing protein [Candidatus Eisenbacteria bacterium]|uniref:XylR N-terminal domain-containing protein n=1 Tax=Eiseniibacteriota bacterium TaxID=2212470 RepID=A0A948RZ07_UNCEI|nr:XylR N-terminal domain-containing protein [Candidatus Eisenbacteria bacterium]MBU1950380.1 XylR N-terminal domain-containing protein [Candidatus Eisenbacteria bacterium]MBU2691752.1 XylR N-terminal domain-containing protein [Candidatus Eisenbacteria bacterium]
MKATDFNLARNLEFNFKTGITKFEDSRLVIFDTNAIGLLRQLIVLELGLERARDLFLKFGFQNGFSDFLQMKVNYEFENEMELLASGPVIHTWEGIVQATPAEINFDREKGEFLFTGIWTNSYEAEQHLCFNPPVKDPVCWTLMGYASGWCTAFFGDLLIAIEPACVGMGDDHCEWKIQPPGVWGDEAKPYLKAYQQIYRGIRDGRKAA